MSDSVCVINKSNQQVRRIKKSEAAVLIKKDTNWNYCDKATWKLNNKNR